ncbi:uncharacterized protein LOC107469037 [Arachis duranensis]|uniref:Uncharacterized protein LOC107469037 n=1 Tax=Arachis duranensis TaxID=130453 RepID=A0A6P4C589_ARADU|nr:uncharacterized protein LOC107469037 [Arachis duranensis]
MTMIDTGAIYNFITPDEAKRLGLKITEKTGWFKLVNTKSKPFKGVTKEEEMTLGSWKGLVDFLVAPMDDFKMIIGLDLQRNANIIPMSYYDIVCVIEKVSPCMIPTVYTARGPPMLSAMQLKKVFKKGEITYLALLQKESTSKREKYSFARDEVYFLGHIIKVAITEGPVLALSGYSKVFEVYTDASDIAIGRVLMQKGHPIAFKSRKLNDTKRRYTVQEKKMTAVVYCLRTWYHYLFSLPFIVKTDSMVTSYFQTQKKLSPKQARWQDFLAEFDFKFEYKSGKTNVVADVLSCKAELAAIFMGEGDIVHTIK